MNLAIAIIGATASGKTALSLELAKHFPAEIISADSRQIYRYLDIGTAKPTFEQREQCIHHFVDILNPDEMYSAGLFSEQAKIIVNDIYKREKMPIIVGGSGLYVQALCEGLSTDHNIDFTDAREQAKLMYEELGRDDFYNYLKKIDVESAEKYSDKNPHRLIRSVEYYLATGKRFSDFQKIPKNVPEFSTLYFGIEHERKELYAIINRRCENMWRNGIFEETERVLSMGYSPTIQSLNTVGYKEVIAVMEGKYSHEQGLELMKQSTRRYAKRQLTWCRNQMKVCWLDKGKSVSTIIEKVREFIR